MIKMADVKRLENNVAKLDEMIGELEHRLKVLEESKVLMKDKISTLKFYDRMINTKSILRLNKLIDSIQEKYKIVR